MVLRFEDLLKCNIKNFEKPKENVSILGFGAMRLPTKGSNDNIDESVASEILSYGIDNGINIIDTAYPYHSAGIDGNGNSEVFIGKFLKENSYRDDVLISYKVSMLVNGRKRRVRILS